MLHFAKLDASGERIEWEDPAKIRKDKRSHAGKRIEVVIRRRRSQRSLDQNAYWHAVPFRLLADAFGYDKDEISDLKLALMGECWGYRRDPISGRDLPVKPHTSDMTTAEGAEFTEWLVRFGAKLGVIVPLPNETEWADDEDAA